MSERASPAAALQRLAGELLGATTPAVIGALVATTAAELLGADAAAVFARVDERTLEALHTTGWPEEITRPFRRLELHRGRPLSDAVLDRCPVWLEDAAQWRHRYPDMAADRDGVGHAGQRVPPAVGRGPRPRRRGVQLRCGPRASPPTSASSWWRSPRCARRASTGPGCWSPSARPGQTAERQLGRMTFLNRTTRLMEAPLSVEERLQQLADLAVSEIADWCAVHLVRGDRVDQVAVAHSDPAKVAFVARLEERYPPDPDAPGGAMQVSRTGEPAYYPEIPDELLVAAAVDDEHLALIRSIGMRSALVVPLAVRGRRLGALTLVHAESERRFDHVRPRLRPAAGGDGGRRAGQRPALRAAVAHRADPAGRAPARRPARGARAAPGRPLPRPDRRARRHARRRRPLRRRAGRRRHGHVRRRRGRRLRQRRRSRGAHRADPAHRARGDRPRARARRGAGAAQPGDAPRERRPTRPVRDRRARPAQPHPGRRRPCGWPAPATRRRSWSRDGRAEPVHAPGTLLGIYPDVTLTEVTFDLHHGEIMVLYTDGVTEARGSEGLYGAERLAARSRPARRHRRRGRRPPPRRRRRVPVRTAARRHRDPRRRGRRVPG